MAPTRRPSDGLLARVNFPLYSIDMLTSRHILVAGGGGSAKTGVANGFEVYELYHNGSHFCAEEVLRHETGDNVVMNFAVANDDRRSYLCAGQESHCQMYHVQARIESPDNSDTTAAGKTKKPTPVARPHENGVRRRGATAAGAAYSGIEELSNGHGLSYDPKNLKRIRFDIRAADLIQTDFLTAEPLQRVVRISGRLMATGGTDGHLRLWAFPKLNPLNVYEAHTKEIDDIDFSPDNKYVVSIAKDGQGCVWQTQQAKLAHKLSWPSPDDAKYLYKRCRYGTVEGSKQNYRLYTLANPVGKVGRQRGYLQQWDCATGKLRIAVPIDESLASLAVRDDGRFVAVGTMFSGSVAMYIGFSLQRVLHIPNAHSMFVTGLQFLPIMDTNGPPISSDTEAAVLSISVDNKVCIHSLPQRRSMPAWVAILILISVICGVFCLCSWLGF